MSEFQNRIVKLPESAVSTDTPIGSMCWWFGDKIPENYFICNGASLSRTDYPELFAVLGTFFGANNETTFKLPNLTGQNLFIRAGYTRSNTVQGDAIRNIIGTWTINKLGGEDKYPTTSGAMYNSEGHKNRTIDGIWGTALGIGFDASRVVPTAEENRPINITAVPIIKYA